MLGNPISVPGYRESIVFWLGPSQYHLEVPQEGLFEALELYPFWWEMHSYLGQRAQRYNTYHEYSNLCLSPRCQCLVRCEQEEDRSGCQRLALRFLECPSISLTAGHCSWKVQHRLKDGFLEKREALALPS